MHYPEHTIPAAKTILKINDLLTLNDHIFIHYAYQSLLGRPPDTEGLRYYLARFRAGFSKISIIMQIVSSEEGQESSYDLSGLSDSIKHYKRAQYPLIGWFFRHLHSIEGNRSAERKLRSIENKFFLIEESTKHFSHIDHQLTEIHYIQTQQAKIVAALGIQKTEMMSTLDVLLTKMASILDLSEYISSGMQDYFTIADLIKISSTGKKTACSGHALPDSATNPSQIKLENLIEMSASIR